MTYEESILLLGNVAQKLDALASTFLEVKEQEDRQKQKEDRTKKSEKKPSKTEKILAPTKSKKEEKKQLKISEPAKSIQILVKQEKEAKDKGQLNLQEKAPKLSETLTSTERKRWENIGNVVATAFKKIFEGREKAKRTAVAAKEIKDIDFSEEEKKLEKAKMGWFQKLLLVLGFLGGFVLGFVTEAIRQIRKVFASIRAFLKFLDGDFAKLFKAIRESKIVKFIVGIFETLKTKFLNLIKIIRESNTFKFLSKIFDDLKTNFLKLGEQIRNSKFAKTLTGFFESVNKKFLSLVEALKNSKFATTLTSVFESLNKKFLSILENIKNIKFKFNFEPLINAVNSKFTKTVDDIKGFKFKPTPGSVLEALNSKFLNVLDTVKNSKFSRTIVSLFESVNQKFLSALKTAQESKIVRFVKELFSSIFKDLLNLARYIQESKLGTFITDIFKGLETKFLSIGKAVEGVKSVKFVSIFQEIGAFFSRLGRIVDIIGAGKGPLLFMSKILKPLPGFLKAVIEGPLRLIFKGLEYGVRFGKFVGKFLVPLAVALELFMGLFKAFTDTKLSDKSFIQKLTTGIIAGIGGFFDIFSIFGLEFFNFDEIRDRIEKIFKPFREGKWIQGIGQILNQVISWFLAVPGKILGWVVGWFSKDLGKKITDYYRNFDLFEWVKGIVMFVPNLFINLFKKIKDFFADLTMDSVLGTIKNIVMFVPNLFMNLWDNVKELIPDGKNLLSNIFNVVSKIFEYSPIGLLYKGAQKLISTFSSEGGEGLLNNIFNVVKKIFEYSPIGLIYKGAQKLISMFGGDGEGLLSKIFNVVEKVFYATPIGMLIKGASEIIKYFSEFGIVEGVKKIGDDIKNKFFGIFDFVSNIISKIFSYIKEKVKNIPLIGKYLVSDEKPEEPKLVKQTESKQIPATINVSGPAAIQQQVQQPVNFNTESLQETIKPRFETSDMFSQENPENVYAMEKETKEPKTFDKFKGELEGLNKNSTVNSKIAVDQLREIKNLNTKIQELAQMMLSNRTLTVNNVSNRSVNAFISPSTVNNFRNNYRE